MPPASPSLPLSPVRNSLEEVEEEGNTQHEERFGHRPPSKSAALTERPMSQPTSVTGPVYRRVSPRPVHPTTRAPVEVPVAGPPSGTWIPSSRRVRALASVTVRAAATRAAAVEMKPSRRMGTRWAAAPKITPTSPAISKPPTLARTSRGLWRSRRLRAMASSSGDLDDRKAGEEGRDGARRRGVSDPHVPCPDEVQALFGLPLEDLDPHLNGPDRLLLAHGGFPAYVPCPKTYLPPKEPWLILKLPFDPNVHDDHSR